MKLIGKGAEAELYLDKFLTREIVVKDRKEKKYRIKEIDVPLRKRRTRNEARLLALAKKALVKVPIVHELGEFKITINRIKGKLLRDSKTTSELLRTAGEYLARLHLAGITHGDYTTANLMVDERGRLHVIDFGLGSFSRDLEDKAIDVLLMKKSLGDEKKYKQFLSGYKIKNKDYSRILKQLEEVERRGRYVVRAMQG